MNRREFFQHLAESQPESPVVERPFVSVPTAGSPRQYARGVCVLVEDVQAWLFKDDGGFYAIDAHCPHFGCLVHLIQGGFICPGHRSRYGSEGQRISGPTAHNLRYLYIDVNEAGHLVIIRHRTVDPRDRLMA